MNRKNILLSVKPKYFDLIVSGKKLYEYRKNTFKHKINIIYFYVTYPIKAVVGQCECNNILYDSIENIWKHTENYSGIQKNEYLNYCENHNKIYAIKIKNFQLFDKKIKIFDFCSKKFPPQNFLYVE